MSSSSVPIVSVIICLYNKVIEIGRAIDSVIAQSISDFELIIVDGGSTDGSLDVVTSYNDSRICLIHQKSKGAAAGRNEGILVTKTDFITFLDADDTWCPDFLSTVLHLRKNFPDAGAYGTSGYVCINGYYQEANHYGVPDTRWEGYLPSYFKSMALGDPLVSVSAVAIPKAVFDKIGVFKTCRWFEDIELFGRIAYYYPIAYSTYIGSVYYLSSSNKVTDGKPEILEKHPLIEFFESRPEEELKQYKYYDDLLLYREKLYLTLAGMHIFAEDGARVRDNLSHVHDSVFRILKIQYLMISYLPNTLLGILRKYNAKILYIRIFVMKYLK